MRVIALFTLKRFWESNSEYLDAKQPTLAWYRHSLNADWSSPVDVKADFNHASVLKDGRVVFNIARNKYPSTLDLQRVREALAHSREEVGNLEYF